MGSNSTRAFVLLALMLAIVLLISSEVAARDLAAQTMSTKEESSASETNGVEEAKYGGYQQGGGQGGPSTGVQGGFKGDNVDRYTQGCCSHCGHGCSCCTYAGEDKDLQTTAKPQNK